MALARFLAAAKQPYVRHDTLPRQTLGLMAATLGLGRILPENGEIPPNYHLAYFHSATPEKQLSPDGFEADYTPPEPHTRRLWSGGRLFFHRPLYADQRASLHVSCPGAHVKPSKEGGDNVFVWSKRDVVVQGTTYMTEERCLLYRVDTHNVAWTA